MLIQKYDLMRNKAYSSVLKEKLQKSGGVCELCGFQSIRFMRLVAHKIFTSEEESLANAKLACPVCADAYDIERAHSKGKIIMLPEMSQSELNSLVFGSWAIGEVLKSESFDGHTDETISRKDALSKNIENLLGLLYKSRSQVVDKLFGYSSSERFCASEPGEFADCLTRFETEKLISVTNGQLFQSLKYLPHKESYNNECEYWNSSLFSKLDYSMLHEMSKHFYTSLKSTNDFKVN